MVTAGVVLIGVTLGAIAIAGDPRMETAPTAGDRVSVPDPPAPDPDVAMEAWTTCAATRAAAVRCFLPLLSHRVAHSDMSPLPPDGVVVVVGGELRRFEVTTGQLVWRTTPFEVGATLRIRTGPNEVVASRPGEVALLDADGGTIRWRRSLANSGAHVAPRIWLLDGDVFVLDTARVLHALDGDDGSVRWSIDDVAPEVVATTAGLLLSRTGELGLWTPDDARPVWTLPNAATTPLRLPGGQPATSPVRLLAERQLLIPATGETIDVRDQAPTTVRVLGEVTLVLQWPDPDVLTLTGLGPGGEVLWEREGIEVPCCLATAAEASHGRVVVGPTSGPLELLDQTTGETITHLSRPDATLDGVAGDVALWRLGEELIGAHLHTDRELFRTSGSVRSLEPLLIAAPEGLIHVDP